MSSENLLPREEYIEQAYFFHTLLERLAEDMPTQDVLIHIHQEVLSTTRLPMAIQFLATEMKHTGLLSSGFARLPHYFTPYQTFIVAQAEKEGLRFNIHSALQVLEKEATYRAGPATQAGLFTYQFEVLSRNRLGYYEGLTCMAADPFFDADWKIWIEVVRREVGTVDFADLIYVRSELYVQDQQRSNPEYQPSVRPLVGEKEGRIAKANRGRDPLYLFAALQRQLGYPEVPRFRPRDDLSLKVEVLQAKLRDWETRLRLLEAETRGQVDLSQFAKPELLKDEDDE